MMQAVLYFILASLLPAVSFACDHCFVGKGATLKAFRLSTVFLTLLPLILMYSFYRWYQHQSKRQGS